MGKFKLKVKYTRANYWCNLLSGVAALYALVYMGLRHYLNFIVSSNWMVTSIILAIILGIYCNSILLTEAARKRPSRKIGSTLFDSFTIFVLLAVGLGPAFTSLSSTVVEKNITGKKCHFSGYRSGNDYFIKSSEMLNDDAFEMINLNSIYITKDQFDTIPWQVGMHVTLKQSFFGTTVEQYGFLPIVK